jgi:prepilin peptidase CpaA
MTWLTGGFRPSALFIKFNRSVRIVYAAEVSSASKNFCISVQTGEHHLGKGGPPMIDPFETYTPAIFLLTMTSVAAGFDIKSHKIPNFLTFPAMLLALCYYTALYGWSGLLFSAAGLAVGMALLFLPYLMGGMGAGDAKLMGVVGAGIGTHRTIEAFLFIVTMGCLYALLVVIIQRRRMKGYFTALWQSAVGAVLTKKYIPVESTVNTRPKVYYGIAIAAGTLVYITLEFTGSTVFT